MTKLFFLFSAILLLAPWPLLVSSETEKERQCESILGDMLPCLDYVSVESNLTVPMEKCCTALEHVVKVDPTCLCVAIGMAIDLGYNINMTRAADLPKLCKSDYNGECSADSLPGQSPTPTPTPAPAAPVTPPPSESEPVPPMSPTPTPTSPAPSPASPTLPTPPLSPVPSPAPSSMSQTPSPAPTLAPPTLPTPPSAVPSPAPSTLPTPPSVVPSPAPSTAVPAPPPSEPIPVSPPSPSKPSPTGQNIPPVQSPSEDAEGPSSASSELPSSLKFLFAMAIATFAFLAV